MSHTSMVLSGLMTIAMLIFFMPGILALNHGKILRNVALWLAIFLGLMLFYKNFGPGSPHPLFHDGMVAAPQDDAAKNAAPADKNGKQDDPNDGSQGFTPPAE